MSFLWFGLGFAVGSVVTLIACVGLLWFAAALTDARVEETRNEP